MPARARKQAVKNRAEFANLMTKMEGGKSQMTVGDAREFLKKQVKFEAALIVAGYKSVFMMLRKEAVLDAQNILKRRKKNVRNNRSHRSKKSSR